MENKQTTSKLPENAYRELKPGEEYEPVMPAGSTPREITSYSVLLGLVMTVIFSAAAAYLGLKVGQVFEAAIPIAILAVGIGTITGRRNILGQNVIIQSIGACSGVIVAGAIFTLPALYILGLEASFLQIFLSSFIGGCLGILLLIPFRKYFVKDMHGKYPFPEATATTEVLVTGENAGKQMKLLVASGLVGGLYDFIVGTFGWWTENVSTRLAGWGAVLAEKYKLVFKVNTGAAVLGLGYIIGLPYATIICAGSFLVWFVIVPLIGYFAPGMTQAVGDGVSLTVGLMSPEDIFAVYARPLGIGGIAMAGIIGILRSSGIIGRAVKLAGTELTGKRTSAIDEPRTQRDLSMKFITLGVIVALVVTMLFFQFNVLFNWGHTLVSLLIVFIITFLFTTVAANAHCHRGQQPRFGDDPDDSAADLRSSRRSRRKRQAGYDGCDDYRRCGMYGFVHGRRIHYRPEDRLLARHHAEESGEVEVPRRSGSFSHRSRCDDDPEQDLWLYGRSGSGGSAGQCDGSRDQAADGRR